LPELLDVDLLQDFAGGGERLYKNGLLIADVIRSTMQILKRERKVLCKSAVMTDDAQYGSAFTMRLPSALAKTADRTITEGCARDVDFAHYAFPNPAVSRSFGNSGDFDDFADKFMARRAAKAVVTTKNFDVGIAYPGETHSDLRPAGAETRRFLFCLD